MTLKKFKIDVKHLHVDFDKIKLDVVPNITISAPGLYGLFAESGTGKTSLLKILTGLLYSSESQIYLSGVDVKNLDANVL